MLWQIWIQWHISFYIIHICWWHISVLLIIKLYTNIRENNFLVLRPHNFHALKYPPYQIFHISHALLIFIIFLILPTTECVFNVWQKIYQTWNEVYSELVQHLNWHPKQCNGGTWFKDHKKQEMSEQIRGSETVVLDNTIQWDHQGSFVN